MDRFRFKACLKCRGDLVLDEGDWLCLQCGTYYYTGLYQRTGPGLRLRLDTIPSHKEKAIEPDGLPKELCVERTASLVPFERPESTVAVAPGVFAIGKRPYTVLDA